MRMSSQKTMPTDADVDAFLRAATPARRREDGLRTAEILREVTGVDPVMWGPSMVGYGSVRSVSPRSGRTSGVWPAVAFSPRKSALTFYGLGDSPEGDALLSELGACTRSVGCVYVKSLDDIDIDVLKQLVAIAWRRADDAAAPV